MSLAEKKCEACISATSSLSRQDVVPLLNQLKDWEVIEDKQIRKSFVTADFAQSLELANKIGAIAESEGHHPDLLVSWGLLRVDLWTHKVNGLTEADFILAAKIDNMAPST